MSDRQSFLDFVRDMVLYLDGEWRIEECKGYDYLKLRGEGLAVLQVFNEGDTRVNAFLPTYYAALQRTVYLP